MMGEQSRTNGLGSAKVKIRVSPFIAYYNPIQCMEKMQVIRLALALLHNLVALESHTHFVLMIIMLCSLLCADAAAHASLMLL